MNIKQLFLLFVILASYSHPAFSQIGGIDPRTGGPNKPADENNFYYKALLASLEKFDELEKTLKSRSASVGDDCGDRICADYHNMIVQYSHDITGNLPSRLGDYQVEYLNQQGLIDKYKKRNKELPILIPHPMENEQERLKISFTFHWFSYKKRSLNYAISDWCNVYFRYDCEKREYVIDEVRLGGI